METDNLSTQGNCIEIRFGLAYSILILILSVLLASVAYFAKGDDKIFKYLIYGMSFLIFIQGIYAISGGKFIKYDPNVKKLRFYGLFGIVDRSIRFDRLSFEGNDLYREVNGKRKYVNFQHYQCKREDVKKFMEAVKLQS